MCGKFTAMASWPRIVAFSEAVTAGIEGEVRDDREIAYRVMSNLPVILWDAEKAQRRVVAMRWGFPHPKDWRRPQPIHARAEGIDTTPTFAPLFRDGRRGIVLFKTFNEAPDTEGRTEQHRIAMGDIEAAGFAFLWRRFETGELGALLACVMVTVPANRLLAALPTDRMPAILDNADWAKWLGEAPATPAELKACLKTQQGVRWTMTIEERAEKSPRRKPTHSDPTGLF